MKINFLKTRIFFLFSIVAFLTLIQQCNAQMPDMTSSGMAKLTIEKKGEKPITYNFPGTFPPQIKCIVHTGSTNADNYTDISCINDFDNSNGTQSQVTLSMRFWPNTTGTFKLPINGDQTSEGHISLDIEIGNTRTIMLDASPEKGTGGTIKIENFPEAVGGKIKGTFDATLMDEKNQLVQVSGSFNIKRRKE